MGGGGEEEESSILKLESAQLVVRSSRQEWRRTDLSVYTRDPAQASVTCCGSEIKECNCIVFIKHHKPNPLD